MAWVELECEIPAEGETRIDRVVQQAVELSRAEVKGLFDHGCVSLNGGPCVEPGMLVRSGDRVQLRYDRHRRYRERAPMRRDPAFKLVFEDEWLLVVDKAAAVLTVPTERLETNTLLDAVDRYLSRKRGGRAAVVHRLDRGTSGLLVIAKSSRIAQEIQQQFRSRKAEREYAAIVAGEMLRDRGTIESRLGTTRSLQRHSVRDEMPGETAITHYEVVERLKKATFLRVRLETGRRNQIRVHMAEAGHPVLGETRYRTREARHRYWQAKRLALHAGLLGFEHPRNGQELRFESPLPREFERFLRTVRGI